MTFVPTEAPLLRPPLLLADHGMSAAAPPDTLAAYQLGLRMGATGLWAAVRCTADGVAVVHRSGAVRRRGRRLPVSRLSSGELGEDVATLAEVAELCRQPLVLALVVGPDADAVIGDLELLAGMEERVWLVGAGPETLDRARSVLPAAVTLVAADAGALRAAGGAERFAAGVRGGGITGVVLPRSACSAGLVATFHRFGRLAVGHGAPHERMVRELLACGVDAVVSDRPDRMSDAAG